MSTWYTQQSETITINVYVQPGAKQTQIAGVHGDAIKIRLASVPIEGRANEALLKYVAQLFDVPQRQVALKRGHKSRHKTIVIDGSKIDPLTFF